MAAAVARSPDLFQRGNLLATVLRPPPKKGRLMRPTGSPVIVPLPPPRLREEITRVVAFTKEKLSRGGEILRIQVPCS